MITVPTQRSTTATAGSGATAQTTQAPPPAQPGGEMGKNEFMKLLIAQMKNQDPMNPMQGDQMAAQLAQFSSLEQLQQINETLTGQSSSSSTLLGAIQGTAAIGMIGHSVLAAGNQVQVGTGPSTVTASFASPAAGATIHIYNSTGAEVGTKTLGAVGGGRQQFDISDATKSLPPGTYTYSIDAQDTAGKSVAVTTYMQGVVDGVSTGQNGLVLTSGGLSIPYGSVIQILK